MKIKYLILLFTSICFSQTKHLGVYKDAFGNKIELLENNKFRHTWQFGLSGSWTIGNWKISNDTLKLEIEKVYDTIHVFSQKSKTHIDSLTLAEEETPKRITEYKNEKKSIFTGRQNVILPNTLFLIRKKKLIIINKNGKLHKEKILGYYNNKKKYHTWYLKLEN